MAVCDGPWKMALVIDRTSGTEEFVFKEIRVTNTTFTGEVWDKLQETRLSYLTGTCDPLSPWNPELSRITFLFTLPGTSETVGISMTGVGFIPPTSNARYLGRFRAFTPGSDKPPVNAEAAFVVGIDVGDTGTGNGMQAM